VVLARCLMKWVREFLGNLRVWMIDFCGQCLGKGFGKEKW